MAAYLRIRSCRNAAPQAAGPRPERGGKASLGAAVIRNSPTVLAGFGPITGNSAIDAGLVVAGCVVDGAIGITISGSPTRQGFHDRLAGGTFVVRRGGENQPTAEQSRRSIQCPLCNAKVSIATTTKRFRCPKCKEVSAAPHGA
jgi:hypothetical protein